MRTAGIIVAAGQGTRFGGQPKQWRPLGAGRVVDYAVAALAAEGIERLILVHGADHEPLGFETSGPILVAGGPTRGASVRAGLEALAADPPDVVLIHDGARPCVTSAVIRRVLAALSDHDGAAPGLPVADALWRGGPTVLASVPREGLWRAQTPQGFRFGAILAAHRADGGDAADDVEVARRAGLAVAIVAGDEDNLKITDPPDLDRAARILGGRDQEARMDLRTGNGFDVHAFGPGDHVTLCGVAIPHDRALVGHSDADVGLHALTDAILGALAMGDIGHHFPPSDPRWHGADSRTFLRHAMGLATEARFRVNHVDVTLICERPKVGPHRAAMQAAVADTLGVAADRVGVKATTSEGLGFTGRGEGIAAMATATLMRP